jgi:hypothetical protein
MHMQLLEEFPRLLNAQLLRCPSLTHSMAPHYRPVVARSCPSAKEGPAGPVEGIIVLRTSKNVLWGLLRGGPLRQGVRSHFPYNGTGTCMHPARTWRRIPSHLMPCKAQSGADSRKCHACMHHQSLPGWPNHTHRHATRGATYAAQPHTIAACTHHAALHVTTVYALSCLLSRDAGASEYKGETAAHRVPLPVQGPDSGKITA